MSLAQHELPHYTYNEYKKWEGRWELIKGIPYAMSPAPSPIHQEISNNIAWQLNEKLKNCDECRALLPVDYKVSEDTVVQPDNLVICYKPTEEFITQPPVLIFEILSKSTFYKDKVIKFRIYEKEGVKYFVLVDPEERKVEIFENINGKYIKKLETEKEIFKFDLEKCKIDFDFSKIWPK